MLLITPLGSSARRSPLVVAEIGLLWNRPGTASREGDVLQANHVRLYGTATGVSEPYIHGAMTPYLALPADVPAGFSTGRRRTVAEIRDKLASLKPAPQSEVHAAMQTCLAWDTVYDPLHDRVISPVSRIWNCFSGGYVMFCWDSYFAASFQSRPVTVTPTSSPVSFQPSRSAPLNLARIDRAARSRTLTAGRAQVVTARAPRHEIRKRIPGCSAGTGSSRS